MTNPATEIFTQRESEVRSYCRNWPVVFDTAKGVHQTTEDGEVYTDFFSGAGALNYGHNNDVLKQALLDYVTRAGATLPATPYRVRSGCWRGPRRSPARSSWRLTGHCT